MPKARSGLAICLLAVVLLTAPACSHGPNDGELVQRDEKLLVEFQTTQTEYLRHQINRSQYLARLTKFHQQESAIFAAVRKHKFSDMTAGNYFYRGRMKFPSPITQEQKRIEYPRPGSRPAEL